MTSAPISQLVSDLASQGKWDEAYSSLFQFAQQNPGQFMNDPAVQYQLGVLAFNNGKIAEAERHLKTSLSIAADNPNAKTRFCRWAFALGHGPFGNGLGARGYWSI